MKKRTLLTALCALFLFAAVGASAYTAVHIPSLPIGDVVLPRGEYVKGDCVFVMVEHDGRASLAFEGLTVDSLTTVKSGYRYHSTIHGHVTSLPFRVTASNHYMEIYVEYPEGD